VALQPDQRFRTDRKYNLHLISSDDCDDLGMPTLPRCNFAPTDLVAWSDSSKPNPDAALHFFADDYRFESLWDLPERYIARIGSFGAALTPDYSLYTDMPFPVQIWNVYRSRALGHYWSQRGISVIPTLQWSTPESYEFAFHGLPSESTVAVSTIGVRGNQIAGALWRQGMQAAIAACNPKLVIVYGHPLSDYDFGNTRTLHFESGMVRRFADGRKRGRVGV
jgi:hypothetical protein